MICKACGHLIHIHHANHPAAANDNAPILFVASDKVLLNTLRVQRIALEMASLELSRRAIPFWLADVLFGFEGKVLYEDHTAYVIDDEIVDRTLGEDPSCKWLGDFIKRAARGRQIVPQVRTVERLRLLDIAVRIHRATMPK